MAAFTLQMDHLLDKEKESLSLITLAAIEAALQAGTLLRQGFGSDFSIQSKEGIHNLVTEYDHRSEKMIIDFLRGETPHAHFLAEESGLSKGKDGGLTWIIDPLDGTVNFAHKIPMFSVSIAAERNGEVISGVVYHPLVHELFVAEKGKGSFLNGQKLGVSKVGTLEEAILATGFPYNLIENPLQCIEHFVDILKLGIPIRRLGAATLDLAYTAAGRVEGFFEVSLAPWDCAAGKLLVEEAGGKVTCWDKSPFDIHSRSPILASNGVIHEACSSTLCVRKSQ
ncbi:MAG: inositol monophosphatase family protein [Chlamydiales bacterium]|nr:inositol monophosphatase family protein [Chlamydiales bacterium]